MKGRRLLCRLLAVLLCLAPVFLLSGCERSPTGAIFRYDLSGIVHNLDPQYATDPDAIMVMSNLFEGLVHKDEQGNIQPLIANRWIISSDGLEYTFYLEENRRWAAPYGTEDLEEPSLTAKDFLFSFYRIFSPQSTSPYKEVFSAIKGSAVATSSGGSGADLGIRLNGPYEMTFVLDHPDPLFLEKLASPGAFPCNQDFFYSAKGRYGLGIRLLLGNGPFRLYQWKEDEYITLRQNPQYLSDAPVKARGVNFFIGRENPVEEFEDGNADVLRITQRSTEDKAIKAADRMIESYETVWAIVFNAKDPVWSLPFARQSLAHSLDYEALAESLPAPYAVAQQVVPQATRLAGRPFQEALAPSPIEYDAAKGWTLYESSLEILDLERMPKVVLYVPEGEDHGALLEPLQKTWQTELSLYVNIQEQSPEQMEEHLQTGEYQMMLVPVSAINDTPQALFSNFITANAYRYHNRVFDDYIASAEQSATIEEKKQYYNHANQTLLADAQVIPVYSEPVYYALGKAVKGLEIHPFGSVIYFKNGEK